MDHIPPARTMSLADLKALCDECGCNPGDEVHLRDALALMGVVYYRQGVFGDRIIVDQGWALDAIYTVFKRDKKEFQDEIDGKHGKFNRKQLERYFWKEQEHTEDEQRTFLSFMEQCGICFRTNTEYTAKYDGFYILPDKLDRWGPEHELQFKRALHDHSGTEVTATFTLLHDGIARGFLSKIGSVAGDKATYWRYGCHFHDRATECEVMIRTDDQKNAIKLHAWGDKSADVLRTLVKVLEQLPCGNPPTIEWSTPPAEPIRIGRDESEKDPLQRLDVVYPRRVFVSYSHEPTAREFVGGLVPVLRAAGWDVVWDADGLQKGDQISRFCEQVRTTRYFVPVFTPSYLRKRWCLSEFISFFESCGSELGVFRSRAAAAAERDVIDDPLRNATEHAHGCERTFNEYLEQGSKYLAEAVRTQVRKLVAGAVRLADLLEQFTDEYDGRGLADLRGDAYRDVIAALERKYASTCRG